MSIHIVRLGSPRSAGEGPRFGTVRRPPRGVPKSEYASRGIYDLWLPELAPSEKLLKSGLFKKGESGWRAYERRYRAEMKDAPAKHLIPVLAALSHSADFSLGCYCADESRCHRSILRDLLTKAGAKLA